MVPDTSIGKSSFNVLEAQGAIDGTQTTPGSSSETRTNGALLSSDTYISRAGVASSSQTTTLHYPRKATTAAEAEQIIRTEMHHAAFGNTPNFFETLFSCDDSLIDQIYDNLTSGNEPLYSEADKCWTSLPTDPPSEHSIYEPLVEIFNAITAACGSAKTFNLVWQDVHSKKVNSEAAADVKPDIIGLLQACNYDSLDLWRLLQTVVEVKKPIGVLPGLLQVLKYSRQALYEQVDRRFIFGLVYARTRLTVWHVDRSGALGSKAFDVHEDPKQLIRVIACMTTKSPVELGWDTHFRMVTSEPNQPLASSPSWEVSGGPRLNPDNPYDQHWWVLSMLKPKTEPNGERENFVIWGAISLARGEVIRGRATRVWLAWKEADLELEEVKRKIYVIKDNWRDDRRGLEGELYDKIGPDAPGFAKIYSYEIVRFDGKKDTTSELVRKGLAHFGAPLNVRTKQDGNRNYHSDVYLHKDCIPGDWEDYFEASPGPNPQGRIHSRTVMESHGSPLSEFNDLQELVKGLHDAIKGHQYAFQKGVLHRDISDGNVLLTDDNKPHRGIMIDLDYAVAFEGHTPLFDDARTGTLAFMSAEISDVTHDPYFPKTADQAIIYPSAEKKIPESEHIVARHETIHDMEGFFWILCWLCISFTGPGARVVFEKEDDIDQHLMMTIRKLFDGENFDANSDAKRLVITAQYHFQQKILNNMQAYFHPLADTLFKLWNVLREAYQTRSWSDIHDKFISIFAAAEERLKDLANDEKRAKYQEMEQAQRDIRAKACLPRSPPAAVLHERARKAAKEKAAKLAAAKAAKVNDDGPRKASSSQAKRKADSEDDVESSGAKKSRRTTEGRRTTGGRRTTEGASS